jgi:hypothetical protein
LTPICVPIRLAILIGTEELARVSYTYYMLEKTMGDIARYLGTQMGVNFCNSSDPIMVSAINNAVTGTADASGTPVISGLTPGMIQVAIERYDPSSQAMVPCDCSATGCDASQGGQAPGYIVVSINGGFSVRPLFWGFAIAPFQLNPTVRTPYGGT